MNNEDSGLPPFSNNLLGNVHFNAENFNADNFQSNHDNENDNQNNQNNQNENQNNGLNLQMPNVATTYPLTVASMSVPSMAGVDPFEFEPEHLNFTAKPLLPMQPGGQVQVNANKETLGVYQQDVVAVVVAHSCINFAAQTYIGLPPGYRVKSISTQENGLESIYILNELHDQFLHSFARTRVELQTARRSLFFENYPVIGTRIRQGIVQSLIDHQLPNREPNANTSAFIDSNAMHTTRDGMYSETIWEFSGWRHQGFAFPLNGYVLCFGRNLDGLGGRRIHPGDLEGGIGCVLLYEEDIRLGYELTQTRLLQRLYGGGFVSPLIVNIGCNIAVGVPREEALNNLLNTGLPNIGNSGEMGELARMREEGRAAAYAAEGLNGPNLTERQRPSILSELDPVTLAMMNSVTKYGWKGGKSKKSKKYKSKKYKSKKYKSRKHKSKRTFY